MIGEEAASANDIGGEGEDGGSWGNSLGSSSNIIHVSSLDNSTSSGSFFHGWPGGSPLKDSPDTVVINAAEMPHLKMKEVRMS